jgi:hypothetical protein
MGEGVFPADSALPVSGLFYFGKRSTREKKKRD